MFACLLLAGAAACGDDKDKDTESEESAVSLSPDCAEIMEACHPKDEGTGHIHECHEIAHSNETEMCTEMKEHCLSICGD